MENDRSKSPPKNDPKNPNIDISNINFSKINYKELTKTLSQFQKSQMNMLEKSSKKRSQSPVNAKPNFIDLKLLESTGLLKTEKKEGIDINFEDIERAFKILDEKNNGNKVSLNELRKKIPVINPNFPEEEIPSLTNGKNELKSQELYELLKTNELSNFDPLTEAFSLLDPNKTGCVDIYRLADIFKALGFGKIDAKDIEILNDCLDYDKDGRITLEDIKEVYNMTK